jgi:hypothetical protein
MVRVGEGDREQINSVKRKRGTEEQDKDAKKYKEMIEGER